MRDLTEIWEYQFMEQTAQKYGKQIVQVQYEPQRQGRKEAKAVIDFTDRKELKDFVVDSLGMTPCAFYKKKGDDKWTAVRYCTMGRCTLDIYYLMTDLDFNKPILKNFFPADESVFIDRLLNAIKECKDEVDINRIYTYYSEIRNALQKLDEGECLINEGNLYPSCKIENRYPMYWEWNDIEYRVGVLCLDE